MKICEVPHKSLYKCKICLIYKAQVTIEYRIELDCETRKFEITLLTTVQTQPTWPSMQRTIGMENVQVHHLYFRPVESLYIFSFWWSINEFSIAYSVNVHSSNWIRSFLKVIMTSSFEFADMEETGLPPSTIPEQTVFYFRFSRRGSSF